VKIVTIFAEKLYAFHYSNEAQNELERLLNLWTDTSYLRQYALQNKISDVRGFVSEIQEDAVFIEDLLLKMLNDSEPLERFFKPLNNLETQVKTLSLQKGRRYKLRLYAIKIDKDLFVITGGAIKWLFKMADHPDTQKEKLKLQSAQSFFQRHRVFNDDSFFELINEEYEKE
jgi:hypothetical protein